MTNPQRTPYVGGNWKMNTDLSTGRELALAVSRGVSASKAQVAVFPPFVYLQEIGRALREANSRVLLGAQDVYFEASGAFTGEVSIAMLKDVGVRVVLTGHSERRHVLGESDELVGKKTRAVLASGLECILCVGEKLEERTAGQTDRVNERQLRAALTDLPAEHAARLTIAYEPVWAIGTGKNATPADAQDAHAKIRGVLSSLLGGEAARSIRIEYGGSVKGSNAAELFAQPDIDGGLIGGASLKAEEFCAIVNAAG